MSTTGHIDRAAMKTSASKRMAASPEKIFALLLDPGKHGLFDGSGMVGDQIAGPDRLELGSKFGMNMKFGPLPYRISNTVVEFVENELIAWEHFGKHRWRYELEPIADGQTLVTETFDWSTALIPKAIDKVGYPTRHLTSIEQTLDRLAEIVEADEIGST